MTASRRVHRLLEQMRRCADPTRARMLADELRDAIGETALARAVHDEISGDLARFGRPLEPWRPVPLVAGETFLLLWGAGGGRARRVRAMVSGAPHLETVQFTENAARFIRVARQGLESALRAIGCGAVEVFTRPVELTLTDSGEHWPVDGPSVGLPCCIALLSRWLDQPPRDDVAGTAEVTAGGSLRSVECLEEKLSALSRAWPQVTTVVVAADQTLPRAIPDGLRLVSVPDVLAASAVFGLEPAPARLPATRRTDLERYLAGFEQENEVSHDVSEWRDLARLARQTASGLGRSTPRGARALGWAAMFALHAGDLAAAERDIADIAESVVSEMAPLGRHWCRLIAASTLIDRDPGRAVELARTLLHQIEVEPARELRDRLLGRANGTLGRALLHAGRPDEALEFLDRAVALHAGSLDEPRSMCYLATGLRHAGRVTEALSCARRGLELLRSPALAGEDTAATELFLRLEEGRAFLATGDAGRAVDAFRAVVAGQASDADYPRLAGLRGLARALRALDHRDAAGMLERCLHVARDAGVAETLRAVAAVAAGEALVDFGTVVAPADHGSLWDVWSAFYPERPPTTETLGGLVY